ncbi:hypothetical protein E4U60_006059 [Claviceps pazoutovae]|uniref:FAR1 domain-containing protein n=1 Tax=Claviceps pazoutovae TaxID=1649127 RepID=A0A9P7M786_9HYPO|nr:hypothetical protein E4U60_006059 [Claviceps pazoutovae]
MMTLNSDCDLQQKEVNLEDIEKMKVEEDDFDSEDESSLGQPALPQEQTFASLGALESYLHDFAVLLGFDVARSKWYGRKNEASGKMSRLYFRCCRGRKQDCRRKADSRRHMIKTECKWKVATVASDPSDLTGPFELRLSQTMIHNHGPSNPIILALVAELSDAGNPARVLKLFTKREHGVIMKSKDIYNLLWRCGLAERRVMNQAERAIKLLEDHGFTLQHDIEEDTGRLKSMSCVHPPSLKDFLRTSRARLRATPIIALAGGLTCSAASGVTKEIHAVAI